MAEDKLKLDIVTPYGHVFEGEVDEVTATGTLGEFTVLPDHAPYITTLKIGMLRARQGSEQVIFFVNWGYAEVGPGSVQILADSAERAEDIDMERAMEAKKRAEEMMTRQEKMDFTSEEAKIERAMNRIQIAERHQVR